MNRLFRFVLLVSLTWSLNAQEARKPITNADVLSMTKAGLQEETIVLAIEQGPVSFETTPRSLVALKKAGVSDAVLNAMLAASKNSPRRPASAVSLSTAAAPGSPEALKLVEKALNAVGTIDKLKSIRTTRILGTATHNRFGSTATVEFERQEAFPDRLYIEFHSAVGPVTKIVITSQLAYISNGQGRSEYPAAQAEDTRTGMKFDMPYVAQHMREFTFSLDGQETVGMDKCDRLRIKHNDGKEEVWSIDSAGKIRRRVGKHSSGELSTENSDFQWVDGVNIPLHRHSTDSSGVTIDTIIKRYQVNPSMSAALFDPPK